MTAVQRTPRPLSAALSLTAGLLAILLLTDDPERTRAVLWQAVGLGVLLAGTGYARHHHRARGVVGGGIGGSVALVALGLGWSVTESAFARLELLCGMVGLLVLAAGVTGLKRGWERRFVSLGTSGLFAFLLVVAVIDSPPMGALLVAMVATAVAWDVGEQSINLGEQLGGEAETWSAELAHAGGSVGVGVAALVLAYGGYLIGFKDVPLSGLLLLAVGVVMLMGALDT